MDDAERDTEPDEIPLEQALEAVARRLAGATAAVDGFAERLLDLLGPAYSEDLALVHQSCEHLRDAIDVLGQSPALALTPEIIGRQIEAGRQARKDADLALAAVHNNLKNAIGALARMTGSVRTVRQQNQWLVGATRPTFRLPDRQTTSIGPEDVFIRFWVSLVIVLSSTIGLIRLCGHKEPMALAWCAPSSAFNSAIFSGV